MTRQTEYLWGTSTGSQSPEALLAPPCTHACMWHLHLASTSYVYRCRFTRQERGTQRRPTRAGPPASPPPPTPPHKTDAQRTSVERKCSSKKDAATPPHLSPVRTVGFASASCIRRPGPGLISCKPGAGEAKKHPVSCQATHRPFHGIAPLVISSNALQTRPCTAAAHGGLQLNAPRFGRL
jgi:hypothetical protein